MTHHIRLASEAVDGFELESGEDRQAEAPETFWLPPLSERQTLQPGMLAKLIFRISVDNIEDPNPVERMWVIVREKLGEIYMGVLDNEPDCIAENDEFWLGTELPFRAEHVINIETASDESLASLLEPPRRRWARDNEKMN